MSTTEKTAGSNLTAIAEYTETAAALADLRQRHQGVVYDVTQPKEMKKAKEARAELRTLRVNLEKKRVEIKAPALERCRAIDTEAKRITAELLKLEEPIDETIKAEEARKEEERLAALAAEQKRVQAIVEKIDAIRALPGTLVGKPSVIVRGQLARLREQELTTDDFAEQLATAEEAKDAAIARIEQLLQDQLAHEAEQKRIEAERAELARLREEAEARRLEDERKAEEARAEQDRLDRERREAEQQRVMAIRQKIAELSFVPPIANQTSEEIDLVIARHLNLDPRDCDNPFDFAELQGEACDAYDKAINHLHDIRRAAVQRERDEYEAAERRADEDRRLQAERERQAAEQRRLDEEARRLQRDREEAAVRAEAERVAKMSLVEAANDAHVLLCTLAPTNAATVRLGKVLKREAAGQAPARGKKAAQA